MLIEDKDITSYQLLLKRDRALVNQSTCFFDQRIWNFFFFYFLVGRWETKHFFSRNCNFSRVCPLVKMASKTVTRSIKGCYFKVRKLRSTLRTLLTFLGEKAPLYCYENLIT